MVDESRRNFLKGLALAAVGSMFIPGVSPGIRLAEAAEKEVPPLPWPYVELDPEETRRRGHLGYYSLDCAGGAFWGIVSQLQEKVGHPWTLLPEPSFDQVKAAVDEGKEVTGLMHFGYGGALLWGALCGALNGSLAAIQMVLEKKEEWTKVGRVLLRWYETTLFPSEKSNEYAIKGQFYPKKLKSSKWLPQSVSHSVLCHVSVGSWCRTSGYASGSMERAERCGRLTGDVAAKAVELLNAHKQGRLKEVAAAIQFSPTTASCSTCHSRGQDYEMGQFVVGSMECETCHKDLREHMAENTLQTAFGTPLDTWAKFFTGAAVGAVGVHLVKKLATKSSHEEGSNYDEE